MLIGVDKAQKQGKHDIKHEQLMQMGYELMPLPLPVGDYILVDSAVQEVTKRRGDRLKKMDLLGVTKVSVDTKADINEVAGNIIHDHARFRDELILAHQNGIQLIILIESAPEVSSLSDVRKWKNWKQLYAYCKRNGIKPGPGMMDRIEEYVQHGGQKPPVDGEHLYKCMVTLSKRYGAKWCFCKPEETGRAIAYLLTRDAD